jgi:hypothetical protein
MEVVTNIFLCSLISRGSCFLKTAWKLEMGHSQNYPWKSLKLPTKYITSKMYSHFILNYIKYRETERDEEWNKNENCEAVNIGVGRAWCWSTRSREMFRSRRASRRRIARTIYIFIYLFLASGTHLNSHKLNASMMWLHYSYILWHANPLLGNARNIRTRQTIQQQHAWWRHTTEGSNHVTCDFCAWSVPRSYLEDIRRYKAVEKSDQEIPVVHWIWERELALKNWVEEDFIAIWGDRCCVQICWQ